MTGEPLSLTLYRLVTGALEPLAPALLRWRAARGKESPSRLGERLGRASLPRPPGPLAWLHGVSVGEGLSLLPLVEALRAARPGLTILVTSGTVASAEVLAQRLAPGVLHQFAPVDAPRVSARFMAHWRPDLAVFVESEIWPNLILAARARQTALALLSARFSASSLAGWGRFGAAARGLLGGFAVVMAQDDATAAGLVRLGARDDGRLNLKRAGAPLPADEAALARVRAAAGGRPLLVAASTHPGEDEIVAQAFTRLAARPDRPLLVLAPRHPVRGEAVAALVRAAGLSLTREGAGETFEGQASVHVADRLGELGLWLRAGAAVLVAGSLVPDVGGHNPLEPARLGTPTVAGPHVKNWAAVYADLDGTFLTAANAPALADAFAAILDRPGEARARADRAEAIAAADVGAVAAIAARLVALIP